MVTNLHLGTRKKLALGNDAEPTGFFHIGNSYYDCDSAVLEVERPAQFWCDS